MVDAEVFVKADIDQAIVAAPAIGMNNRARSRRPRITACSVALAQSGMISLKTLPCCFSTPNTMILPACSALPVAPYALCSEVRFIHFHGAVKRRGGFTHLGNALAKFQKRRIHRAHRHAGQSSRSSGCQIQTKTPQSLSRFSFANSRTLVIPVFDNHLQPLSHIFMCLTS